MRVAIAQIAPLFLDRDATLAKMAERVVAAGEAGAELVAFGEALAPAYPIWLSSTGGSRFDDADQKRLHARYLAQGVCLEEGHLDGLREAARAADCAVVAGIVERPLDRGGHSLFCTRVIVAADGEILSTHRKLMPTYEERLCWATGDGAGLVTHRIGEFTVGALNCWENWMPLARYALYAAGENLHVMLWPGAERHSLEVARFVARESRSYVLSACGLIRETDLPADLPLREQMAAPGEILQDGGSAIAGPDGRWLIEPVVGREELLIAELDLERVFEERQNFDPAGHYSRPDVLRLEVDRRRLTGSS